MTPRQHSAAALLALLAGSASSAMAQSTDPFPPQFQLSSLLPVNGGDGTNGFVLNGINTADNSGRSVSSAGDVNGDGFDDLIIGANLADQAGLNQAGETYVVFGGPGLGSNGEVELASLRGPNGFVLNGVGSYDQSGISVSSAGDVNSDGIDDLVIGAINGNSNTGECYVVFGSKELGISGLGSGGSANLSSLNGTNGFTVRGIDAYDNCGRSVSSAGDVNGDGTDDLIIGAPSEAFGFASGGESYVVFGSQTLGASGLLELSSLIGSNGFTINGIDDVDYSGNSVSSAGDVNGDGFDDVIIGANYAAPNGMTRAGESYVVLGGPAVGASGAVELALLNGSNGFVINGIDSGDYSGRSVSSAGDVNGDGIDDVIIGAFSAAPNGINNAGQSYVLLGSPGVGAGGIVNLSALNGNNGYVLNGSDIGGASGISVSSAGDVNADGIDDVIVGAYLADPNGIINAGESSVVFGGPKVGASGAIELSSLDGISNGFTLNGIDPSDSAGISVSSAGDVNGDGVGDVIIGARSADPNGNSAAGESYVVFGRANANLWVSPAGGDWDQNSNWQSGVDPIGGIVTIDTPFGVTVSGPTGAVLLDRLTLAASLGTTTLEMESFSLVSVQQPVTLPASAALTGSGVFVANDDLTNFGLIAPSDMALIAANGLSNHGELDLSALTASSGYARLQVSGPIDNQANGEILLRNGSVELDSPDGVNNFGSLDVAFADAAVLGPVNNAAGSVSISGASSLLIDDDVTNASTIVLTDDSALVILGSIIGNGVSGPGGGGTAGSVYVEGGVIPGLVGQPILASRFDGDLDLGPTAYTIIEIGGTTPGVDMDQLSSAANLGAAGTLEVQLVNGYTPQPGDVYPVLQFATASGSFSSIVLDPGLIAAGAITDDLFTNGTIFISGPCPADTNGDGILDNGDIGTFVALFLAGNLAADFNGDGILDNGDIGAFVAAFLAGC